MCWISAGEAVKPKTGIVLLRTIAWAQILSITKLSKTSCLILMLPQNGDCPGRKLLVNHIFLTQLSYQNFIPVVLLFSAAP
ncbi:hypothetical protein CS542_07790 [Pedobacter sp. IW39]|nr:hypothetical protein CS542_07790 [Pedobacter sp. IW39]